MLFQAVVIGTTICYSVASQDSRRPRHCRAEAVPHSLLQRSHGLSGSTVTKDDDSNMKVSNHMRGEENKTAPPACEGVDRDERCWYLSEKGEDCHSTCLKYGRAFKFGVPNQDQPMVPQLLKMEKEKNGEGGAFECYKPEKEHYTLVNRCSANDYRDNAGSFKDPDCQLACPCGGVQECSWKQPEACVPVFAYNGEEYSGCPTLDKGAPWCSHAEENSNEWSACQLECVNAASGDIFISQEQQ